MAEIAFSEDGKYFSAISQDGRLKIWDTETNVLKQEYTPDLHLTSPPSCLQWLSTRNTGTPRKGRRNSSISENEIQCIALGTTNGKILIYSVSQARVETVLYSGKNNEAHSAVTCLDWHRKDGLFSCHKEGYVQEWDVRSGQSRFKYNVITDSKNKQESSVTCIKIVPQSQKSPAKYLVTASWQVKVWSLVNGAANAVLNLGHSGSQRPLLSLASLETRTFLILGSRNERLLSFWDVTITPDKLPQVNGDDPTPTKKQRKKSVTDQATTISGPTYNFVLEDAPRIVDAVLRNDDGCVQINLAAATRSGVVHYYGHVLNGSSTKPIKPTVTLQVTSPDATPLPLQCCKLSADGAHIVIGYESTPVRLTFERCTPETKSKTQVLIRGDALEKDVRSRKHEANKQEDKVTYVEPAGAARKRVAPGGTIEVPMEARLENLSLDTKSRGKSAVNQNLTKLLVQGLHSKDKDLILTVLQNNDSGVASRTVACLPADYVPLLLEQLGDLATRKTSQCASVCTWLSALLHYHSALLLATLQTNASGERLATLLAVLTQRRSHLCQLLNLKGRLSLTTSQRAPRPTTDNAEPVLEYNDASSDEEMDLQQSASESESWDELHSDNDNDNENGDNEDDDQTI